MMSKEHSTKAFELSLSDSMQLKGIALLLLLLHHLFYEQTGLYDDIVIENHAIVQELGKIGKVCVAIFVFLSGYGLGAQYRDKEMKIWAFYKRRFTKLYKNYWLIWLLFVPVGILFFGRTLDVAYGNHIWTRLLINLTGLQDFLGFYGYNATWWFMSCIIGLYFLFPFYILLEKVFKPLPLLLMAFFLWSDIPHFVCIRSYIFPFAVGICMAQQELTFKNGGGKRVPLMLLLFATIIWRQYGPFANSIIADPVLTVEIMLLYKSLNVHRWVSNSLEFIGKHSMNIFLFHSFIYYYYFQDFIYCTHNPLTIYMLLLSVCLIVSMGIEWLKGMLLFRRAFK